MQIAVGDILVNYEILGNKNKIPLLILHGWGRGSDSYVEVMEKLSNQGYQTVVPDLPGFGKSAPPPSAWGVDDAGICPVQLPSLDSEL